MRQLLEVAGEERERGNDGAKDCDVRSDHPANVVDQVMGEAIFDSVEALIHIVAQLIGCTISCVEAPVCSVKSAVYSIKPLVHFDSQFAHVIASRISLQVFCEQFFHVLSVTQVVLWLSSNRVSGIDRPR